MGGAASIPVVSQAVSLGQVIVGDVEGARRTQIEFVRSVETEINKWEDKVLPNGFSDLVNLGDYGNNSLYLVSIPLSSHLVSAFTEQHVGRRFDHFRLAHQLNSEYVMYDFGDSGSEGAPKPATATRVKCFSQVRNYGRGEKGFVVKAWRDIPEERVQSAFDRVKFMGHYNLLANNCQTFCTKMVRELTGETISLTVLNR
mmetsp:Transcript_24162/g.60357  ORF Transcript_24162/g.60357 Transcript_24162/m.60357 type:complete len:200 (+) Transcript_24162:71-670(+)|eukprot:CAMPEP_0115219244 /NCGR_PEP_ID=MMETSP0270-20121206/26814_1 /TAXON_ID=71861 /ORGANISM="Scrippsiella trochoidea, Strain CCMP3099" /LENGTH=199 /DNA_ID=CAMNT_0002633227 /DNA_START=71 /DNA_END=670 /DNA_ORIENTATION=+